MGKRRKGPSMQRRLLPAPPVDRPNAQLSVVDVQAAEIAALQQQLVALQKDADRAIEAAFRMGQNSMAGWFERVEIPRRNALTVKLGLELYIKGVVAGHLKGARTALDGIGTWWQGAAANYDLAKRTADLGPLSPVEVAQIADVYEAVQRVVTGDDNGTALLDVFGLHGPDVVQAIVESMPNINRGRGSGSWEAETELIAQAAQQRRTTPGCENESWGKTANALKAEFAAAAEQGDMLARSALNAMSVDRPDNKVRKAWLRVFRGEN
jgi:hypothetical protein